MTELEKAAVEAFKKLGSTSYLEIFKAGANWQYEQFEKNRLTACDNMTKEEAEREQEFVTDFLEKNLYAPTYSDAIEYSRKMAFDKTVEWLKEQDEMIGISFQQDFIERFKRAMEEQL